MKKNIVFLIILTLFLSGCFKKTQEEVMVEATTSIDNLLDGLMVEAKSHTGTFDGAVVGGSTGSLGTICESMENIDDRIRCNDNFIFNTAIAELDAKLCQEVSMVTLRDKCISYVGLQNATSDNDLGYCESLEDEVAARNCVDMIESRPQIIETIDEEPIESTPSL